MKTGKTHRVSFWKVILAKTCYEAYKTNILAIVKTSKNLKSHFKSCKYSVFDAKSQYL